MNRPLVIGLTGGIASGKSAVAEMFSNLGAAVIDADKIGHMVLEEESIKTQIRNQWGEKVIRENRVSRKDLAAIVFDPETGAEHLEKLEAITHPRIRTLIADQLAAYEKEGAIAVVLDAPLLFEAHWDEFCDKVLFVACDTRVRIDRALQRGWSQGQFHAREANQLDLRVKQQRSTDQVDNSGDLEQTKRVIQRLWLQWGLTANLK